MLKNRVTELNNFEIDSNKNCVVYWITREFRSEDNWSLIFAQYLALEHKQKLVILINLLEEKNIDYIKPFNFYIEGLFELKNNFEKLNVPVYLNYGNSKDSIPAFLSKINASALVTDFFPLKYYQFLVKNIIEKIKIPFYEIDSHNIVPCRIASPKLEFAAYTIRPKIKNLLPLYLINFPNVKYHSLNDQSIFDVCKSDFDRIIQVGFYNISNSTNILKSGETSAKLVLNNFIKSKITNYANDRNNPNLNGISGLSPYIHFGQISAQRIALEISKLNTSLESKDSYLEELIIRRELGDNFCFNNSNYDSFEGFHQWAKKTLNEHSLDKREYIYTIDRLEHAQTHDPAWNAAQNEMVSTGKMHGYMRMYWAKKMLEWTNLPEESLEIGIYLNDKYSLDGYDPNGYVGLAWSIGGVHDRAWNERAVFGKIRYMNYAGLQRKFDVKSYETKWNKSNLFINN